MQFVQYATKIIYVDNLHYLRKCLPSFEGKF